MPFGLGARRAVSSWRTLKHLRLAPRSYHSSNPSMSITQDKVDLPNLSLPSKPAPSLASRLAPGPSSLHPKLNFALPPKPTGPPPSSSSFSPSTNTRGITSPSPPLRERNDFYRPFSPPRSLSPPPRVREYTDSYIPSPSPPRRYRSPTPPRRRYSRSLVKRRRSPSPSFSRSRSVTREVEDPTPRTTFYTHSHRKEEALELKRQKIEERNEAREKAKKEKEDQWAEYQKRRSQLDQELDQTK